VALLWRPPSCSGFHVSYHSENEELTIRICDQFLNENVKKGRGKTEELSIQRNLNKLKVSNWTLEKKM
jgi:hypothetical protein